MSDDRDDDACGRGYDRGATEERGNDRAWRAGRWRHDRPRHLRRGGVAVGGSAMSHRSTDRTLLQLMGFDDPDLRSARHDSICAMFAHDEVFTRWLARATVERREALYPQRANLLAGTAGISTRGRAEVPIVKGSGQYRMVVGFADVVLECSRQYREVWDGREETFTLPWTLVVEVKSGRISDGLLLRQMNTYREFGPEGADYAVAFDYVAEQSTRDLLLREGFLVIERAIGPMTWSLSHPTPKTSSDAAPWWSAP